MKIENGRIIDHRYRLVEVVGRGSVGVVYAAERLDGVGGLCALKVLDPQGSAPHLVERFEREARVMARVHHRSVVPVIGAGRLSDGRPYVAMELLEGETVYARSRRSPLNAALAVRVLDGVLEALTVCHDAGIIHRDVKASNVMLLPDEAGARPVLLDFGLARDVSPDMGKPLTARGDLLGTPTYMAPEMFQGHSADVRTDLYAVGCLFHMIWRGRPPFDAGDEMPRRLGNVPPAIQVAWLHLNQPPPRLEGASEALAEYVEVLLSKQPEARFRTASAARRALQGTPEGRAHLSRAPLPARGLLPPPRQGEHRAPEEPVIGSTAPHERAVTGSTLQTPAPEGMPEPPLEPSQMPTRQVVMTRRPWYQRLRSSWGRLSAGWGRKG